MPSANVERYIAQQQAAEAARKAAAKARAEAIAGYVGEAYSGRKYAAVTSGMQMIGIQDAVLFWATESGVDNSTDDAGNSGLHKSVFDTTTYADSAQIKLLNDSGATQYVRAVTIKAKPVWRRAGELGFTHDSFVDYQDIFFSGERVFEFGNNYVVTKAQLEQLADYYAKALGALQGDAASPKNKHIYVLSIPGRGWHYEPGEWVTVQMGGSGEKEYIDSVCEIYSVSVEAGAGDLGTTILTLREVEQNWVKDSNAVARFLATGDPKWKPNNFGQVVVAARDYLGVADYYCDGTADNVEIQAAIDYLSGTFGGGLIDLTEGQYNIIAAIDLSHSDIILRGKGFKTIIEKNCDDYAIKSIGTSTSPISGVYICNLKITRNSSDTNALPLVYLTYSNNSTAEKIWVDDSDSVGLAFYKCKDITVIYNTITNCAAYGLSVGGDSHSYVQSAIIGNIIQSNFLGMYLSRLEHSTISNNTIDSNTNSGIRLPYGRYNTFTGNVCHKNGDGLYDAGIDIVSTANSNIFNGNLVSDNNGYGFYISAGCKNNVVTGNRGLCNITSNFTDAGEDNTDSGNDWSGKPATSSDDITCTDTAAGTVV